MQQSQTVDYTTALGIYTADRTVDFLDSNGTLTFTAGQTTATINVTINGDTIPEPDETLMVTLQNPVGLTRSQARATGTILNDDGARPQPCRSPTRRLPRAIPAPRP